MSIEEPMETLIKDRLEFRRLLGKYHLLDLIGDSNESIEWFRQIMLELAGWLGERERARVILQRFREEYDRQGEEQERFERAVETGFPNPHIGKRFRRINILHRDLRMGEETLDYINYSCRQNRGPV